MKWIIIFSLFTLTHISVFGQTPEKMSYQAIIRDNAGILLENSNVNLKIVLRQGSTTGAIVYEESHNAMTNKNGLLSLEMGTGTIKKGVFKEINWTQGPFFIETHMDPKGNFQYTLNGVSEILSVPYALHAKSADFFTGTISPTQLPDFYTADEIDHILIDMSIERTSTSNFTGDYRDLVNKPELFSGIYSDLQNKPVLFSGAYSDLKDKPLLFSGSFADLRDKPELYDKTEIDKLIEESLTTEESSFSGLYDDLQNKPILFSGLYNDLQEKPELYNKKEIDNLIQEIETTGSVPQTLSLENGNLSISEGNSISFENWDTNAADDFSGIYEDLQNKPILFSGLYNDLQEKPELYNKKEIDNLIQGIETTASVPQTLSLENGNLSISEGNSISFENWDTNAADDFSGIYDDLQNKPVLFSGLYNDLEEKPELYNKKEIDNLIRGIETTGSVPQFLSLENGNLSISEGNSIFFENWDTNAADDFSGIYDDLQNKPVLFSGLYNDLEEKPELYNKAEIDNLIQEIETTGSVPQTLSLENSSLTISEGNSISFENWDTNAADDFDGKYTSLTGSPKIYTQAEVDAIKAEILASVKENYSPKARIVTFSSSRNVMNDDVNNTVACTSSATLTITSEFSGMKVGETINLEVHGTTLTVKGETGVTINGTSGYTVNIGNNQVFTGGLIRKTGNNIYIVL